ncbi:NAD-dependent epimerase/dehydratase family protein [Bacillus sp. CGMCC 1.16607]|uniref:NAD-dependent epimerase/dehydratase family protein n=1 Tax=Bacillus sp. CGMCC 1.16607 TaxID=3351842 RepID=UPI00363C806C
MKQVLVLGGTKFFGKKLVQLLLEKGAEVTIATRGKESDEFGHKVKRLMIDRENKASLEQSFQDQSWDVVYDQSCYSPQEALDTVQALNGKVKRYIFTSTMAVYDFGLNRIEEDFNPYEFNFEYKSRSQYPGFYGYQEAKRAAEAVLFAQKDLDVVAVRFPIVISKDDYTERLKFHVDKVLNGESIGIPNVHERFSFILANEAAQFLYEIGASSYTGPINPGSKGSISLAEILNKIETVTNKKALVEEELTKENASPYAMPGSLEINTDKAVGMGSRFSNLNETIDELIAYYIENR